MTSGHFLTPNSELVVTNGLYLISTLSLKWPLDAILWLLTLTRSLYFFDLSLGYLLRLVILRWALGMPMCGGMNLSKRSLITSSSRAWRLGGGGPSVSVLGFDVGGEVFREVGTLACEESAKAWKSVNRKSPNPHKI